MAKTKAEDLFAKFEAIDSNRQSNDKGEKSAETIPASVENKEKEEAPVQEQPQSINMSDIKIIPAEKTKKIMRSATLSPKAVENWEKAAKMYSVSKNSFLNQLLEGLFE